ncbi:MAG: hypothetical protein KF800_16890 [Lysobacter sp.]|nr:hypothetical protein [Lysobacter sp.]
MKKLLLAAVLGCALTSALAWANPRVDLKVLLDQQNSITRQIEESPDGMGIDSQQLDRLRWAQRTVADIAVKKSTLDRLSPADQIRLRNALGEIYAILKGTRVAQEQRDVCWRERRIGSQIQSTRCATFEELLLAREGTRAWMEDPPVCASKGNGCGVGGGIN